jgi:serine/threonine protein kinase
LGAGGMGEVYVAKDESLDRNVALKVLPPNLVRDEDRVRRFVLEAKSASSLNHPNIVTIYEIGHDRVRVAGADGPDPGSDPVHYISMELVSGESLSQKIHEEKTDLRTLLGYLAQAAEGIAKAHAAGIVHRDLKPGNIMVSRDGFAKVLDFGLAKLTEKSAATTPDATSAPTEMPATGAGAIMGTVGYMSPEQVQGKPVDARSDVFALGCVIYEAATRKRPFAAESDVETMHRILRDRPTPVEEINPQVPADVRRIIRRCLAKSPDERFQSMKDLAIELREAHDEYESLPLSGPSGSSVMTGSIGAPPRSRRGAVIGIAAAIVVVAALVGGWLIFGKRAPAAVAHQDVKMSVLMSRDDIEESVISADGRYLAFVTSAEEKTSLNVRQVRTGTDVRILAPQEFPIKGISFSPDGDYLYYLNQDPGLPNYQALFQVASLGGTPRKVFFDVDTAASISPDGARVCFRRGEPNTKADTLVLGDLATGTDKLLIRISDPESFQTGPAWSPDARHVAVARQNTAGEVRTVVSVIDVTTGQVQPVGLQPFTIIDSLAWLPDGSGLVVSGFYRAVSGFQIFLVSYPGGQTRRLTSDLNGYQGVSIASASRSIAATRESKITNIWLAAADGGAEANPVTRATGVSGSATGAAPLPGGDVAYAVLEGELANLWRAKPDGSDARKLTSTQGYSFEPRAAGRNGVVFNSVSAEVFTPHVWRVDADGGGLRQLTDGKGEILTEVSRDGATAYFRNLDDQPSIWLLDLAAGGEPRRIVTDSTGEPPQTSPDGTMIQYSDFTTIDGRIHARRVIMPRAGGEPIAKFVLPPSTIFAMWMPDGKAVCYLDRNKGWNLMRQPIAGGEPTQVTHFTEGVTTSATWSPDGRYLAVVRRIGTKVGLWIVTPAKGEPKMVTEFRTGTIIEVRFGLDSKTVFFTYGTSSKDVVLLSGFQ